MRNLIIFVFLMVLVPVVCFLLYMNFRSPVEVPKDTTKPPNSGKNRRQIPSQTVQVPLPEERAKLIDALIDSEKRAELLERAHNPEERTKLVKDLIDLLEDEEVRVKSLKASLAAVNVLGKLRAQESIPVLCKLMLLHEDKEIIGIALVRNEYPAVGALIDIGTPALPSVLGTLVITDNEQVLEYCKGVIGEILGGTEQANQYLLKQLESETNVDRRKRIEHALKLKY